MYIDDKKNTIPNNDDRYKDRINSKILKNKALKMREYLEKEGVSQKKINILTTGIESRDDYLNRQRKVKRISGDRLANRITNDVSLELINKTHKKIKENNN